MPYTPSAALTWKNVFSILPALSSSVSTFAFWMKEPRHTKMLAILASSITLTYNITAAHSPSVYVAVSITMLTSIVSLVLYFRKKNLPTVLLYYIIFLRYDVGGDRDDLV
ncbi:MAG: YgjV family protein [Clostridia bacterium]|nr:YgjV family protein [Clostridia bacterium]